VIVGLMFSGDYITSCGDTWYLEFVLECFDIIMLEEIRVGCPDLFSLLSGPCGFKRDGIYGDDIMLIRHKILLWYICGVKAGDCLLHHLAGTTPGFPDSPPHPVRLDKYLKRVWHMQIKRSDTYVCLPSDPRPDMALSPMFSQIGKNDVMVYRGPKFLKRQFIFKDGKALTWRPIDDYMSKCIVYSSNRRSHCLSTHILRLRALALDTHGTNPSAYKFIKLVHDNLWSRMSTSGHKLVDRLYGQVCDEAANPAGARGYTIDKRLLNKIGLGNVTMLCEFPKLKHIRDIQEDYTSHQELLRQLQVRRRVMHPMDINAFGPHSGII